MSGQGAARAPGLDAARALLLGWIVIVVHAVFWLKLLPQAPASLFLFEMAPIFMIAGAAHYLATQGEARGGYWAFLTRRAARLLVPYFAYAAVAAAFVTAVRGDEPVATLIAWLNPVMGGDGHTFAMLSWHLWFVPVFLAVTAFMPMLARVRGLSKAPLWLMAAGGATIVWAADGLDPSALGAGQMIVFYALWTVFGCVLASAPARYGVRDYALVLGLSLAALAGAKILSPADVVFDMQANKFPPNSAFFLFCCAWMALILAALRGLKPGVVETLAGARWLQPFMRAGYSIYLWQGLGYTAALLIGRALDWSVWAVWPLAAALSVALGLLAAPLERLRLR